MSNDKGCSGICTDCVPQIDGGSGFHHCAEAHTAQLAEDKAVINDQIQPLTDSELVRLIWGLKAEGFHPRLLAGLIELKQRREYDQPVSVKG